MGNIYGLNLCITKKARSNRAFLLLYREWDLNPHSHHWPKDFKSFVSTDSTIAALQMQLSVKTGCKSTAIFLYRQIYFVFF